MARRFSTCLNLEARAANYSLSGLVVGVIGLIMGMCFIGLFGALFFSAVGFIIGAIVGRKWHNGSLQRSFYWKLPLAKISICDKAPESHTRTYH